jgi:hypothetical protein
VWLKAVAQAIMSHVMRCFLVLVSICHKLKSNIADHWWGFADGGMKMHWKSWEWLSSPKSVGGLGFRDFVSLAKQCLVSSVGGSVLSLHLSVNGFSRAAIFLMWSSCLRLNPDRLCLAGDPSRLAVICYCEESGGVSVMRRALLSSRILGSQASLLAPSSFVIDPEQCQGALSYV